MITHEVAGSAEVTGIQGITSMKMKLNGKAYGAMVDRLYSRKEDAVIRELGANARDAMNDLAIRTNTPIQPFTIQLPNDICHELIVKDNGTGLSVSDVEKYLGTIFESSKEDENLSIGSYGLGSKSPFAVTDSYTIESRFNGELHHFTFFRAKGSVPQLVKISSVPTTEPNGITFRVPAPPSRYETYKKAVAAQLFFFDPRPDVGAHKELWDDYAKIKMEGSKWKFIESAGLCGYYGPVLANMGGVSYPVEIGRIVDIDVEDEFVETLKEGCDEIVVDNFKKDLKQRARDAKNNILNLLQAAGNNIVFGLFFNIGDLEVPPSRENLEYDTHTCYNIILAVENLLEEITQKFIDEIKKTADPSDPRKLRSTLMELSNIINWDSNKNKSVAPWAFCDPIRKLTWEISLSDGLPSIHDNQGQIVTGKYIVSNNSPTKMLDDLKQVFPHHLVDKQDKCTLTYACTIDGVFIDKDDINNHANDLLRLKKEGYISVKKEIKEYTIKDVLGYRLVETFIRDYKEWVPVLYASENISPINGRITANIVFDGGIKHKSIEEERDYYGNIREKDSIYILIDDEEKSDFNSLTKYGTWALRRSAGGIGNSQYSDVECLGLDPKRFRHYIRFLKGNKEGFEFFEKWNAKRPFPSIIWKLSEMVIPKAPRLKDDTITVMRGVKCIEVRKSERYKNLDDCIKYQTSSFSSVKAKDDIEPGFIVFNNGKNQDLYLDKELTIKISTKEILKLMVMHNTLMEIPKTILYRLTPSSVKHLDNLLEGGFEVLYDVLKKAGTKNNVGSNQFQRRYKASMLTWAFFKSDTFKMEKIRNESSNLVTGYQYQSSMMKFMKECKIDNPMAEKHISRLNRSMSGYQQSKGMMYYKKMCDIEIHAHAFVLGYKDFYGKLKSIEAWRIVIDMLYESNLTVYTKLFGNFNYAYRIIHNTTKNFRNDRAKFLSDKYQEVLFGGFFERDSKEFTNALEVVKKKLGYGKVDKQTETAVKSTIHVDDIPF